MDMEIHSDIPQLQQELSIFENAVVGTCPARGTQLSCTQALGKVLAKAACVRQCCRSHVPVTEIPSDTHALLTCARH